MTDKERLELIKEVHKKQGAKSNDFWGFVYDDIDFLIEQAERVQELESYLDTSTYINRKLRKENRRYREALKHIQSEVMKVAPSDLLFEIYDTTRKGLGEV